MSSQGHEPSLEAVRSGTEGVAGAFTLGLRYAFLVMAGMLLTAMTISALQRGRVDEPEPAAAGDLEASQAET